MLVVIAAASVFAAAMSGLVTLNAATVETGAVASQARAERAARAAAVIALQGLVTRADAASASTGAPDPILDRALGADTQNDAASSPGNADTPDIEIPEWIREIIGEQADELEDQARERGPSRSGAQQRSRENAERRRGAELLRAVGLPRRAMVFDIDNRPVRVRIRDARSGLDINRATPRQLAAYFKELGVPFPQHDALANQIADWIDTDRFTRERSHERDFYASRGVVIRDGEATSVRELLYLPAMTPDTFTLVRDGLTVGGASIHVGSAPRAVLIGLGFTAGDIAAIRAAAEAGGPIDQETLRPRLSLNGRELFDRMDIHPGSVLRVDIEVFDAAAPGEPPEPAGTPRRFEGIAVMGATGLQRLAMRAAPTPINPTAEDQ